MKKLLSGFLLTFFSFALSTAHAETDPRAMLEGVATNIVDYLKKNKDKMAEDEQLAKDLVRKELLPYVDEVGLGRRVLGSNWKKASPEQQKVFVEKFTNLVIDTYAKGLSQYDGQTFEFSDTQLSKNKKSARVRSEMKQTSGSPVKIDYLLKKPKGLNEWRVVDVTIEGISMVQSYRNQFNQQIKKEGLDSIIAKLSNNELDIKAAK
ncbi:phospholipid-binding protein MlaC [Pleionea sp. CnH1-48]|uniref:MlaC/ttg2D family ABC transporter substrate-binding protein n=1 Tax=Pleionea sp. CnH1-48 TaxID=2954494 RepID=UPI002097FA4B|nr:ABC transporter substrate-binding protein [Pleionea sp. CnH1-48]MCO7222751.1 ABC transporter substrate-binding protein [Pleionea sp. CnH1-48]